MVEQQEPSKGCSASVPATLSNACDNKRISYAIFGELPLSRLIGGGTAGRESIYNCDAQTWKSSSAITCYARE